MIYIMPIVVKMLKRCLPFLSKENAMIMILG